MPMKPHTVTIRAIFSEVLKAALDADEAAKFKIMLLEFAGVVGAIWVVMLELWVVLTTLWVLASWVVLTTVEKAGDVEDGARVEGVSSIEPLPDSLEVNWAERLVGESTLVASVVEANTPAVVVGGSGVEPLSDSLGVDWAERLVGELESTLMDENEMGRVGEEVNVPSVVVDGSRVEAVSGACDEVTSDAVDTDVGRLTHRPPLNSSPIAHDKHCAAARPEHVLQDTWQRGLRTHRLAMRTGGPGGP
jgi:hypothetical protein